MKVGTDGVLLGAWCPVSGYGVQVTDYRILDVGTGCGLIARMLMQRCPEALIDAIDIDPDATEQAKENGVNAYCASLQEWQGTYDLIVSNPPYFQNSLKNPDKGRQTARHTDTLSYEELVKHSARLLSKDGQLALILPAEAETELCDIAARYSLYCTHVTRVYSKENKKPKRVMMVFARIQDIDRYSDKTQTDSLVLEDEKGGRSRQYQELCKEFYL